MALSDLLGMIAPQTNSTGFTVSRPDYAAGFVNTPSPPAAPVAQAPQSHGLFSGGFRQDSPLRNFLGALADAVAVSQGGKAIYHESLQQSRSQSAIGKYLGEVDPEMAGLLGSGIDSETALNLYKARHPASEVPDTAKIYEYRQKLPPEQQGAFDKVMATLHPGMIAPITLGQTDSYDPGTAPTSLPHVSDQQSYDAIPPGGKYTTDGVTIKQKPGGATGQSPSRTF